MCRSIFQSQAGPWNRGLGDIAFAFKRTVHANARTGRIGAAGLELIVPTGKEQLGLGGGATIVEPFVLWGQMLPRNAFVQFHAGAELPIGGAPRQQGSVRPHRRSGTTLAQDRGFGRAWSPQIEVLWARPEGGTRRVGRRPAGAGHAVEAPARDDRRRRAHPLTQRSRALHAGAGLPALGLVRRRPLRVLAMSDARVPRGGRRALVRQPADGVGPRGAQSPAASRARHRLADARARPRVDVRASRPSVWRVTTISSGRMARMSRSARAGADR